MSAYKFTPRAVASPDAPQKPLGRKRARSGVAKWVQVSRRTSASPAKRPRTAGSQQPARTHNEHQILTTAEAASFASRSMSSWPHALTSIWRKMSGMHSGTSTLERGIIISYRTVGRVDKSAKPNFSTTSKFPAQLCNLRPTHTFLKRHFLTDFKNTHIPPPPPKGNGILSHRTKSSKTPGKMQNPPCWHKRNGMSPREMYSEAHTVQNLYSAKEPSTKRRRDCVYGFAG